MTDPRLKRILHLLQQVWYQLFKPRCYLYQYFQFKPFRSKYFHQYRQQDQEIPKNFSLSLQIIQTNVRAMKKPFRLRPQQLVEQLQLLTKATKRVKIEKGQRHPITRQRLQETKIPQVLPTLDQKNQEKVATKHLVL